MIAGDQEITLNRTIQCPAARVYAAFTSSEGWCTWCSETAEVEPVVGGRLHIYTEGYHAYGEFTELEPDRTITFTWNGDKEPPTIIHVSLIEQDHSTLLKFKVAGLCSEQDWAGIVEFLEHIWGHVLNNLRTVLEEQPEI